MSRLDDSTRIYATPAHLQAKIPTDTKIQKILKDAYAYEEAKKDK